LVNETPATPVPTASPPYSPAPLRLVPRDAITSAYPGVALSPRRHVVTTPPKSPRATLAFSCMHARASLVRHTTMHGSKHTMPRHPRLAPLPSVVTQTHTRSHAHELKQQHFRPRQRATNATDHIRRLSSPCHPRAPPLLANCFQRDHHGPSPSRQYKALGRSGNSGSSLIFHYSAPLLLQSTSPMEPLPLCRR
jgi:hypothetical protein